MGGGDAALDPGVKAIHNGADDNASGTTVVMQLARDLAAGGSLDRSVIFVAFTGEEWGLLGSRQFVEHPPVPLEKIVAMINLDMVGRVRDEMLYIGGGGTAAPFQEMLQRADDQSPLKFKDIGKGGFGPSDHMSFAMHKIPVLFLFSGLHGDYHRATDDADKINYAGLRQVEEAARQIVKAMATMPRAEYVAASDAKSYSIGSPGGGRRVTLGVVPDYSSDITTGGVKISGAVEGSPAEKAGLKGGDVIVGYDEHTIDSLYDLSEALAGSKAGDVVKLKVKRDAKTLELKATLAARGG
jgi:hypothetical protein